MNPAVTLAFLRLGKVRGWDALYFVIAQTLGGLLGIFIAAALLGRAFTEPPVSYVVTVPGASGTVMAFMAEAVMSFGLMDAVLRFSASPHLARYTGLAAGCLVAVYISVESPLSGMSMNPARTLASAAAAMNFRGLWVYLIAPPLGMLVAAQLHLVRRGSRGAGCAKLLHTQDVRCIHCGYEPGGVRSNSVPISSQGRRIRT